MTISEICLVVIASILAVKSVLWAVVMVKVLGSWKREVRPLLVKAGGVLDNASAVSEQARENMDLVREVIEDVSYKTRQVTNEVSDRVVPSLGELVGAAVGVTRFLRRLFGKK